MSFVSLKKYRISGVSIIALLATCYLLPVTSLSAFSISDLQVAQKYPSTLPFFVEQSSPLPTPHSPLTTSSVLAFDIDSLQIWYAKNPAKRLPLASLTKLMTAVVVLDHDRIDDLATVTTAAAKIEPSKAYLLAGDKAPIGTLLTAALIGSLNDAMLTVAGTIPDVLLQMNKKAFELKLLDTHFSDPVGLDKKQNYSSAADIGRLTEVARSYPLINTALSQLSIDFKTSAGKKYSIQTTDKLLGGKWKILAGKTGTTDDAGQCLMTITQLPDGRRIMIVLLGSKDRFGETEKLLQHIEENRSM